MLDGIIIIHLDAITPVFRSSYVVIWPEDAFVKIRYINSSEMQSRYRYYGQPQFVTVKSFIENLCWYNNFHLLLKFQNIVGKIFPFESPSIFLLLRGALYIFLPAYIMHSFFAETMRVNHLFVCSLSVNFLNWCTHCNKLKRNKHIFVSLQLIATCVPVQRVRR